MNCSLNTNGPYWVIVWRDRFGRRRRKSIGRRDQVTQTQAREIMAHHAEMLENPGPLRLGRWLQQYYEEQMHSCNERTMTLIARTCTLLRDHFGGQCDVAAIDAEAAAAWRLTLYQAGLATTTAARHVQRARHIWQVLKDRRLIEWNPFDAIRIKVRAESARYDYVQLSEQEVHAVIEHLPTHQLRNVYRICWHAGLRRSEALALVWTDFDPRAGVLQVRRGKGGTARVVRLESELWHSLEDNLYGTPTPNHVNNLRRHHLRACEAAGVEPWGKVLHTLRANRATIWRQHYPEHVVDAWMGHSLAVARKHYVLPTNDYYTPIREAS
jgi:integrase